MVGQSHRSTLNSPTNQHPTNQCQFGRFQLIWPVFCLLISPLLSWITIHIPDGLASQFWLCIFHVNLIQFSVQIVSCLTVLFSSALSTRQMCIHELRQQQEMSAMPRTSSEEGPESRRMGMPLVSSLSHTHSQVTTICCVLPIYRSTDAKTSAFSISRCDFLNYRRNMSCRKCNGERPKQEISSEYEDQLWESPRERWSPRPTNWFKFWRCLVIELLLD